MGGQGQALSLKQLGSSMSADQEFLFGKMLKELSPQTMAKILRQSSKPLPTLGAIDLNGNCVIHRGFYPKTERESTLSDILQKPRRLERSFPIQKDDRLFNGEAGETDGGLQGGGSGCARTITARYWKMGSSDTYIKMADYRNDEGLRIRGEDESPCLSARRHSEKDISTMPPLAISRV